MPTTKKQPDFFRNAIQLGLMAAEANAVIAMRLWGMAGIWSVTKSENDRMVSEKVQAAAQSLVAANRSVMAGKSPDQVVAAAIKPVRRKTRANSERLAKRGPKFSQS
ncbi:hypothetical protein [Sulfitobacter guttiformis]|uniref:Antifreeze protein n=1 Tax=Sulfitobacter guttiformis TaxID=74349 RepID=A0A420DPC0_9RHOB|nr:hypothetical protein [Sulfitobacter guttiformis]KIN73464.1 Antifreeze protein, type I [Sulfitobacter guttiformis KCTC 32187]RKE96126.1 hypothetical protein C8N30_0677 [Sulfitobacter guttiformis]